MSLIFKGLFKWSLQITGASIIWFNYQSFERQQKILGIYGSLKNSYHFVRCLYGLSQDFKSYTQNINQDTLKVFKASTARKLEQLCEQNNGAYARIASILSGYTDIIPSEYTTQFRKISNRPLEEVPYADIKNALAAIFKKDMKELYDGFQTKPLTVGLFTQTHKAILLQNYREAVVKVLLPSLKVRAQYDIWFINKAKDYVIDYLKKNSIDQRSFKIYAEALDQAENVVKSQLNLEQQLSNIQKTKSLMNDGNSSFYVPYYFTKLCNSNVITRQFIEGVYLDDFKGLKSLGIPPEVAFAYVLQQVQRMMKKLHLISGSLDPKNIMIRKYIKPYKPVVNADSELEKQQLREKRKKRDPKVQFTHSPYQVIFLSQNNLQEIPSQTSDYITAFWNSLKKDQKRVLPSVSSFYQRLPFYQQLKSDPSSLKSQRYYLYQPLIRMYETIVRK